MTNKEALLFVNGLMDGAYGWHINNRLLGMSIEEFEHKCEGLIRMLKAQEPRLMTLEEVARCSMCWLEDQFNLMPALFIGMEKRANGQKCDVFLAARPDSEDCEYWYDLDEYGDTWRCWTDKPTDEQAGRSCYGADAD